MLVAGFAPGAAAQPGDAFAAGSAAFADGDYAAALRAFERARAAGADGPAVHYNIGVCQYRLGDHAAAAETFRTIAARFPGMRAVADYNLGLALTRQGRTAAARAAYARAARGEDDTVAGLAAAMLGRLRVDPAETRALVALVDVAAGHDDNVALVDELSVPAASLLDSAFVEALGYVDAPFGRDQRFALEATGYWIDYRDASPYDQLAMRAAFDYRPVAGARRVTLGPYYERTKLGGAGFEARAGLEVDFATRLGERATLSLRLGLAEIDALDARYSFVEGDQQRVRARLRRPVGSGVLSATYGWERNDRAGASVSPTRNRLALDWRRRLAGRFEAELGLRFRQSDYDELAMPRIEKLGELRFDVARDLERGWQVRGGVRFADNDSTDPRYAYERRVLSVGLRNVF